MKTRNRGRILLRYALVIVLVLVFSIAIVYKAVDTCVIHSEEWNKRASEMLDITHEVMPERGDILSQDGEVLATNMIYYRAVIDFTVPNLDKDSLAKSLPELSRLLAEHFPGKSSKEYKESIENAYNKKRIYYVLLRNVTGQDYKLLKSFPYLSLPTYRSGFYVDMEKEKVVRRERPYGSLASRAIGGLNETFHGNSGLEKALDSLLYGIPGKTVKKQITSGIVDWIEIPAQRGLDVKTTIDIDIQDVTEQSLMKSIEVANPDFAIAVVMEVATGEIKAMSNLTRMKDGSYDERENYAVRGYEPGSVVKPLTMMVALDDGIVQPHTRINGHNGRFNYPGGRITDTHGRSSMTAIEAMKYSSNVGLAQIALMGYEKDPDRFVQRIYESGFMDPLDLKIPGAVTPSIRHLKPTSRDRVNLTRMAYGYTTRIPPIYTLALYNAIANDGKFVRPRLVKELIREGRTDTVFDVSYVREQACKPSTAKALRHMLYTVVNDSDGTGRLVRSRKVPIAGKTGTARLIGANGQYESRYRITFCGFFPYDNPQYSCIVMMERPDLPGMPSAGRYCGGVLKSIAETLYSMGRLNVPISIPTDTTLHRYPSVTRGSRDDTRQVLSQLNVSGDVSECYDMEILPDSMPDLLGMGARDALFILEREGVNVSIQGRGRVVAQSVPKGAVIQPGTTVVLKLE